MTQLLSFRTHVYPGAATGRLITDLESIYCLALMPSANYNNAMWRLMMAVTVRNDKSLTNNAVGDLRSQLSESDFRLGYF